MKNIQNENVNIAKNIAELKINLDSAKMCLAIAKNTTDKDLIKANIKEINKKLSMAKKNLKDLHKLFDRYLLVQINALKKTRVNLIKAYRKNENFITEIQKSIIK